jgi:hypothetical protein
MTYEHDPLIAGVPASKYPLDELQGLPWIFGWDTTEADREAIAVIMADKKRQLEK